MTQDDAMDRVNSAQKALSQALKTWNAADIPAIQSCHDLLENSVASLQELHDALARGMAPGTGKMRSAVVGMRHQIRQFTKLVDASSAFVRALSVYSGAISSTYKGPGESAREL